MGNLQNRDIDYKVTETVRGITRSYVYENGQSFREFKSHLEFMGMPFVHITIGKCPETGRRIIAKGFIAIGRFSVGIISIGHVAAGFFAVGQAALGFFFLAQGGIGLGGIGQIAITALLGIGQLATGYIAIGQLAIGYYVLGQAGFGTFLWTLKTQDPEALEVFRSVIRLFKP